MPRMLRARRPACELVRGASEGKAGTMITVWFDCASCGLKEHALEVPARETEDIDVVAWMRRTVELCADEHKRVSPHCRPETLQNLKFKVEGMDFIGQQVE